VEIIKRKNNYSSLSLAKILYYQHCGWILGTVLLHIYCVVASI